MPTARSTQAGFSLLEALIASAIMVLVVTSILGIRTASMIDAAEARNWRVAREKATSLLTELKAGGRDEKPEYGMDHTPIPGMQKIKGWSYKILIGETAISDEEGDLESMSAEDSDNELRSWQNERDTLRKARAARMSYQDYEDQQLREQDELNRDEDQPISEDEFEEVAVIVYFPNVRIGDNQPDQRHFILKARISTLALEGLTPEEAERRKPSETEGSGSGTSNPLGASGTGEGR